MFNESQGYISYNKGALVIFYLQEVIGKERIHQALRNYLDRFALQGPPFPTSRDLVDAIRAQAGPEYDRLITDLFERIMFYEVAVDEGSATANAGGYSVTIPFSASQFEADGQGNLTEVPLSAWFEVVVFPVSDAPLSARTPLYRQMHFVESGQQTLTVEVGGLPAAVGIDPFHMLIDSRPGDNVASVLLR
jgi:aminopeptidase N